MERVFKSPYPFRRAFFYPKSNNNIWKGIESFLFDWKAFVVFDPFDFFFLY